MITEDGITPDADSESLVLVRKAKHDLSSHVPDSKTWAATAQLMNEIEQGVVEKHGPAPEPTLSTWDEIAVTLVAERTEREAQEAVKASEAVPAPAATAEPAKPTPAVSAPRAAKMMLPGTKGAAEALAAEMTKAVKSPARKPVPRRRPSPKK